MKKILFIINGICKIDGKVGVSGGDIRMIQIAKLIKGYDINFLTTTSGGDFLNKFGMRNRKQYKIDADNNPGIISNLVVSLKSFFSLPKDLNSYKGLVYSSSEHIYDVLPAIRLKFFNKCEWYAVYHWVEDYPWIEKRGGTPFLKRYLYWLNRYISGFLIKLYANRILAVSDQTREKLINIKKINPSKIKSVYCGVEYNHIVSITNKYKNEKGKKYDAIYVKRLNNGKGVFDLLKIWNLVVKSKPNSTLAIIGDGPRDTVNKMKKYIKENNMTRNITFMGVIYDLEEKFRIINSAKVFILPSHEENWAIVIGESMATRVPVIAYNLKEIKPIWKDNVEWVKTGNISEFAEKILNYIDDERKRAKITQKAFSFIKQYDWKRIAEQEFK